MQKSWTRKHSTHTHTRPQQHEECTQREFGDASVALAFKQANKQQQQKHEWQTPAVAAAAPALAETEAVTATEAATVSSKQKQKSSIILYTESCLFIQIYIKLFINIIILINNNKELSKFYKIYHIFHSQQLFPAKRGATLSV